MGGTGLQPVAAIGILAVNDSRRLIADVQLSRQRSFKFHDFERERGHNLVRIIRREAASVDCVSVPSKNVMRHTALVQAPVPVPEGETSGI